MGLGAVVEDIADFGILLERIPFACNIVFALLETLIVGADILMDLKDTALAAAVILAHGLRASAANLVNN